MPASFRNLATPIEGVPISTSAAVTTVYASEEQASNSLTFTNADAAATSSYRVDPATVEPEGYLSTGDIAGVAVGAVVGILLFAILAAVLLRRYSRKRRDRTQAGKQSTMDYASDPGSTSYTDTAARTFSWSMNVGRPSIRDSFYNEADGTSNLPSLPPIAEKSQHGNQELAGSQRFMGELAGTLRSPELPDGGRHGVRRKPVSTKARDIRDGQSEASKAKSFGGRSAGGQSTGERSLKSAP